MFSIFIMHYFSLFCIIAANHTSRCKPSVSQSHLRRSQINLSYSKLASASLAQIIIDLNIDPILLQEPYAVHSVCPVIPKIPCGYSSHHKLNIEHAFGSCIVVRDQNCCEI